MGALYTACRAGRLLRWGGPLESSALLASRGFSSSSGGDQADNAASLALAAAGDASAGGVTDAAAGFDSFTSAADSLSAAASAAAVSADDFGVVLGAAVAAVDGLHAATGLPWWATLSAVGVAVRVAMFPISLQGMKASAALMPLLRQARDQEAASMQPPSATAAAAARPEEPEQQGSSSSSMSRSISSKQQRWQRAQQQAATAEAALDGGGAGALALPRPLSPPPSPSTRQILARFHQLRQQAGAPHPIWVLASPLAQVPVFVTAMTAIRTMSLRGWPGFSNGGTAWFTDLTLPAMDLEAWTAPLVPAGSRGQASVMLWVMGGLRLLLEWMMVPLFAVALQLPHGALCYWATSSSLALAQNQALKQPAVRRAVGLPTGPPSQSAAPPHAAPSAAAAAEAAVAAGAAGPIGAGVDPALRQFLLTTSDQAALFARAAELRAEGRAGATSVVLQRLLQLYPGQPNALYALGQVHAALKDWPLSEQCYLQAARSAQLDAQSRARSWFGAAVAMHMQGEHDTAISAFGKAAAAADSDGLRVRCWVSQATLHRKLGQLDAAVQLLRKAARAEPKVDEAYLQPLLAEMAGEQPPGFSGQEQQQLDGAQADGQDWELEQQQQQQTAGLEATTLEQKRS
ncbi:ALBINO3-like protein 2 [Chlorella vulgaris]